MVPTHHFFTAPHDRGFGLVDAPLDVRAFATGTDDLDVVVAEHPAAA